MSVARLQIASVGETLSAAGALRAALGDMWRQSWRLLILNAALSVVVVPFLVAALWVPLALVPAVLVAGPLGMALMYCAVTLAQTEELSLRFALTGLRLHWRRGLVLGALAGVVLGAGIVALASYGRAGSWPLVAFVVYVLAAFGVLQLALWPLAVAERSQTLRQLFAAALRAILRRPLEAVALTFVLLLVNLAGAAAALMPLLTLTVAFSFLAAAHFTLPRSQLREGES